MTRDEFRQATEQWSGVKSSPVVVAHTTHDWSHARISCFEYPSIEARQDARRATFKAVAGSAVGINHADEGRTLIVVSPNDDVDAKVRRALGAPKFSAALYTAQP